MRRLHITYVTARTPWGNGEDFVLSEILELRAQSHRVTVCPTRPGRDLWVGDEPHHVASDAINLPWLGARTLLYAVCAVAVRPLATMQVIFRLLLSARSWIVALKNLSVIPKGLAVAWSLRSTRPDHIHAHWASTSSSAAMIGRNHGRALEFHSTSRGYQRGQLLTSQDIVRSFVRAISYEGVRQLQRKHPQCVDKIHCIHMGCRMETGRDLGSLRSVSEITDRRRRKRIIACPANLLPVKGTSSCS